MSIIEMSVARSIMNAFVKKWFLGTYKGPIHLDFINGEMEWLDEANAALTVMQPREALLKEILQIAETGEIPDRHGKWHAACDTTCINEIATLVRAATVPGGGK